MTAPTPRKCRASLLAAIGLGGAAAAAHATGALENPPAGATVSGIAVLSGWHCTARRIEVEIDGGARLLAGSGTDRLDTQGACGRRDTGFPLLFNWGVLPAGTHTLREIRDEAPLLTGRWNAANLERRSACANAQNDARAAPTRSTT